MLNKKSDSLSEKRGKNMKHVNFKSALLTLATSALLVSCGGGGSSSGGHGGGHGGGGGGCYSNCGPSEGWRSSSYITVNQFVDALNDVDGAVDYGNYDDISFAVKYTDETVRGEGFFVYFDSEFGEYIAVDIDYLRTIEYWDYYSSNTGLADTFRDIQDDDEFMTGLIGDGDGLDYEIVDYFDTDFYTGEDFYIGFDSNELYEDEVEVTDTSLAVANEQEKELYKKASSYSVAFKIPMDKALSLASLEKELKKMAANAQNGELSEDDTNAMVANFEHFTGVSMEEFNQAKEDGTLRDTLVEEVKANIGTESSDFEDQILSQVFDI